jgi:hypothetical protein
MIMSEQPDFGEDDFILSNLDDDADVEAFTNLMEHAHLLGMSAADFVRQEPKRTSRKGIRKLCLKNQKRTFKMIMASVLSGLWDRPANDTTETFVNSVYAMPKPTEPHVNGHVRKASRE